MLLCGKRVATGLVFGYKKYDCMCCSVYWYFVCSEVYGDDPRKFVVFTQPRLTLCRCVGGCWMIPQPVSLVGRIPSATQQHCMRNVRT